jgi:hypothetical protein
LKGCASMKKTTNLWLFFSLCIIFIGAFCVLDRSYYKKNNGFCPAEIHPTNLERRPWDREKQTSLSQDELLSLLKGPFTYLGKGHQTQVFENATKDYVIKFYRFAHHSRPWGFFKHPLSRFSTKRKKIRAYDDLKFLKTKQSFALAFARLNQESGLVAVHLDPSDAALGRALIYDASGNQYTVSLDDTVFVVQKKGELIFPLLLKTIARGDIACAKEIIDNAVNYFHARSLLSIKDEDPAIDKNYGIFEGKVFQLDVGRLIEDSNVLQAQVRQEEAQKLFAPLHHFLQQHSFELSLYLEKKVAQL